MKHLTGICLAALILTLGQAPALAAAHATEGAFAVNGAAYSNSQGDDRLDAADGGWRNSARKRIEHHRKADLEIRVSDAEGNPIPNATVVVRMTRHRFGFGALIGTSRWQDRPNAQDARRHLELVADRFNRVVTILREEERSSDLALDWLTAREIRVRGHYLMWAPIQPGRGRGGQPTEIFGRPLEEFVRNATEKQRDEVRKAVFSHIERLLNFGGKRVAEWDAINHIANDSHIRFSDLLGPNIYADVINHARELAPHAQMWVNEGNVLTGGRRLQKYHEVIAELIALGAKPDGIGFMAHFREGEFTRPEEIYRRLDHFSALVPNLQLTELDIDTSDEQIQADYLRDVLTIAFSHPAVSGIVMWQVWGEGAGHKALWRSDWSLKPAGLVWLDSVFKQWWTDETGVTDGVGTFRTRGFLGNYEVSVRVGDHTRTVHGMVLPEGGVIKIVL